MKIFNYKEYSIVCETWETSNAWGHKATILWHNYSTRATAKIRYYNRTWERYQYQSVILKAISDLIDKRRDEIVNDYKTYHNVKRLTQSDKDGLWAKDELLDEYEDLLKYFNEEVNE